MTHTWCKLTKTHSETDTPLSPLTPRLPLLKHKHAHWISSHSSWLEPPSTAAGGIHSPRMLGQLCRYWMRRSWSCLSLHAVQDYKKKKNNKKTPTCYWFQKSKSSGAKMRSAHFIFVPNPKKGSALPLWKILRYNEENYVNLLLLMQTGAPGLQLTIKGDVLGGFLLTKTLITNVFHSPSAKIWEHLQRATNIRTIIIHPWFGTVGLWLCQH